MSETRKTIALTKEIMIAPPPDISMDEIDLMDQPEEIKSWEQLLDKIKLRKATFLEQNEKLENAEQEFKKGFKNKDEMKNIREERMVALHRWRNIVEMGELIIADDEAEARYTKNTVTRHECANRMKILVAEKNEIEIYKIFKKPSQNSNAIDSKPHATKQYMLRRPPNPEKVLVELVSGNWTSLFTSCFGVTAESPTKKPLEKETKEFKKR